MLTFKSKLPLFAVIIAVVILTVESCTDSSDSAGNATAPSETTDTLPMDTATTRPVKTTN